MPKSTNEAVKKDDERWRRELDNVIGSLFKNEEINPSYFLWWVRHDLNL